jgi:hypothetical protein
MDNGNAMETERLLDAAVRRAEGSEFASAVRRLSPAPLDDKLQVRLSDIAFGGRLTQVDRVVHKLSEQLGRGCSSDPGQLESAWSELGSLWRALEGSPKAARDFIADSARELQTGMVRFEMGRAASLPSYGDAADWYFEGAIGPVDRDRWKEKLRYLEAPSAKEIFPRASTTSAAVKALRFIQAYVLGDAQTQHAILLRQNGKPPPPDAAQFAELVRGELPPEILRNDPTLDLALANLSLGGEPGLLVEDLKEIVSRFAGKPGWDKSGVAGTPPAQIFKRASACFDKVHGRSPEATRSLIESFHPAYLAFSTWQKDAQEETLLFPLGGITPILEATGFEADAKASGSEQSR